jgi:4-diphosphocytidyl-2-C-methyl-D-erythritol kinase
VTAQAKVNLFLHILAREKSGYHQLETAFCRLALADDVLVHTQPARMGGIRTIDCRGADVGPAGRNLAFRAAVAYADARGWPAGFRIEIEKRIPVGGGLGGGSSDAAAVLKAAMSGAFGPAPDLDWVATARSLGSDVPFFLVGTGALVEGTGERLTPVGSLPVWWVLIVRPSVAVDTAQAYHLLASSRRNGAPSRPRSTSRTLAALDALQRGDFLALQKNLVNDFHEPILEAHPLVAQAHASMIAAGAPEALLSGSGSCLFALFEDEAEAREAESKLPSSKAIADTFVVPMVHDEAWR